MAMLPVGTEAGGWPVGGLSALAWDAAAGEWLALSDDGGVRGPARYHRLRIELDAGRLGDGAVEVLSTHLLLNEAGEPFREGTVDPEGLALGPDRTALLLASEGSAQDGLPPFVGEFSLDPGSAADGSASRVRRYFEVPRRLLPGRDEAGRPRGVRHNLAFEALALTPGGDLWVGVEGPLAQDGPEPAPGSGARTRLLRYDPASGRVEAEALYPLDPVPAPPSPEDQFMVNGLVELLAFEGPAGDDHLLALERSFVVGRGHFLRLYRVSVAGAADTSSWDALPRPGDDGAPYVGKGDGPNLLLAKELVLDLGELGEELYNVEGLAWGPELADGRRLLLLVSDDNFGDGQRTQFFAFAADPARLATAPPPAPAVTTVATVQGAAHVSPRLGRRVEVAGVVTAVTPDGGRGGPPGGEAGFWLQDPLGDGDPATSEGVFVATPPPWVGAAPLPAVAVGDRVRARGWVVELGRRGGLTVTALSLWPSGGVEVEGSGASLPAPRRIGGGDGDGSCPPPTYDDDGLATFQPAADGLDFWESLEGMRVELAPPQVVGPTSRYGEIFVTAAGCAGAAATVHGGLLETPESANPERLALTSRLAGGRSPELRVGQSFTAPVAGVLAYDFADYRLLVDAWPPAEPAPWQPEVSALDDGADTWTVATLNLENLSVVDRPQKFARLVETVVDGLGSPAVLALQEVQDDSGAEDDGVVTSAATLARFVDGVRAAGGPLYEARWVDPADNADGGRPGGNIRNALLVDPSRVAFVDRGAACPDVTAGLSLHAGRPALDTSPGRLAPGDPAFDDSRKPLVAELEIAGEPLFVVVVHFVSKGGDDALMGPVQPPVRATDAQRRRQAEVVAGFAAELLAADPAARLVVLGDFNDFPWRHTLAPLADAGLVNLMRRLPLEERYTYVYEGNSTVLDHVMVSPALAAGAEVDAVHRHADLPDAEKPSDHDPVLVRLPRSGDG